MNRLKELRENKDLLQKDLAKYLNISQTNYSKYELERIDMTPAVLKKLARFYNTNIDYLLYETDDRKRLSPSIMNNENEDSK